MDIIQAINQSLDACDLNGQIVIRFIARRNNAERNTETAKSSSGLVNQFFSVNKENNVLSVINGRFNDSRRHNGFTCAARSNAANTLNAVRKIVIHVVDKFLLVGTQNQDKTFFQVQSSKKRHSSGNGGKSHFAGGIFLQKIPLNVGAVLRRYARFIENPAGVKQNLLSALRLKNI